MEKMNDRQRKLAQENYGLIWAFCQRYHVDFNEYSGLLSIALCEACIHYDESKGGKFSSYAFTFMINRYRNEYNRNLRLSQIPQDKIVYGDTLTNAEEENLGTILDNISSIDNIEEIVILKDMMQKLRNEKKILTDRQKQMLECVLLGLSNKESQIVLNLSLKRTEQIKSDLRKGICSFLESY